MKIVCIKNSWESSAYPLTIGKVYELLKDYDGLYVAIIDDDGAFDRYTSDWFMNLDDYRQKQLGKII